MTHEIETRNALNDGVERGMVVTDLSGPALYALGGSGVVILNVVQMFEAGIAHQLVLRRCWWGGERVGLLHSVIAVNVFIAVAVATVIFVF